MTDTNINDIDIDEATLNGVCWDCIACEPVRLSIDTETTEVVITSYATETERDRLAPDDWNSVSDDFRPIDPEIVAHPTHHVKRMLDEMHLNNFLENEDRFALSRVSVEHKPKEETVWVEDNWP